MRMSRLFGTTLREAPAGVRSASQELLVRAGFIRPAGRDVYAACRWHCDLSRGSSPWRCGALERQGASGFLCPSPPVRRWKRR